MSRLPLSHFNNVHKGERGFVIGGGPSLLNLTEEEIGQLKKEVTVGANKAYKLFHPTYLCYVDRTFHTLFKKEFDVLLCPKFTKEQFNDPASNIYGLKYDWGKISHGVLTHSFEGEFSFPNSGAFALNIAFLLGCNPIYLLGIDLKSDGEQTHFHADYSKKEIAGRIKTGLYRRMTNVFVPMLRKLASLHVQVYTTTFGTVLDGVIPYVNARSVLLQQ
jgi:hypothetical protein